MILALLSVLLAFSISVALTPMIRAIAPLIGMVDHPDQERKLQARAVALGGGLAVFAAMTLGFVCLIAIDRTWFGRSLGSITIHYYYLFGCAGALLIVGLTDDLFNLRGRQKLLLQILIVTILVGTGTQIHQIGLLGYNVSLGVLAYPFTVLWLLFAINALNLIDGADGMASTIGAIICLGLGWLSFQSQSPFNGYVCFLLGGALLGFLVFNKPPATIYLGDAGSMVIGLFVGVLSIWANVKESTVLSSAPIAILALPLFDSGAAIIRRWLTGRSLFATDRGHLHHLLQQKYGNRRMLLMVGLLGGATTLLSVLSVRLQQPILAVLGVVAVLGILVLTRSFGHAETKLIVGRAAGFAQSFAVAPYKIQAISRSRQVNLQGTGRWESIWLPLEKFAQDNDWTRLQIDLNMAWLHESYHAMWRSKALLDKSKHLTMALPLFTHAKDGRCIQIGRLQVVAPADDSSVYDHIGELSDYLQSIIPHISQIVDELELAAKQGVQKKTPSETEAQSDLVDSSGAPLADSFASKAMSL
jgi:UDP-GlcNAc:undecaprenyl-phosphate/decaprenyl-phosphate GlcNAc-1-phosphate transferase